MTLALTAASCFVAGMLVEAVVWTRATRQLIRRLRRDLRMVTFDRDRWREIARTRHPSQRSRHNGHLRVVDK